MGWYDAEKDDVWGYELPPPESLFVCFIVDGVNFWIPHWCCVDCCCVWCCCCGHILWLLSHHVIADSHHVIADSRSCLREVTCRNIFVSPSSSWSIFLWIFSCLCHVAVGMRHCGVC